MLFWGGRRRRIRTLHLVTQTPNASAMVVTPHTPRSLYLKTSRLGTDSRDPEPPRSTAPPPCCTAVGGSTATENFGPYLFRQLRIGEFPRYASFARSPSHDRSHTPRAAAFSHA